VPGDVVLEDRGGFGVEVLLYLGQFHRASDVFEDGVLLRFEDGDASFRGHRNSPVREDEAARLSTGRRTQEKRPMADQNSTGKADYSGSPPGSAWLWLPARRQVARSS